MTETTAIESAAGWLASTIAGRLNGRPPGSRLVAALRQRGSQELPFTSMARDVFNRHDSWRNPTACLEAATRTMDLLVRQGVTGVQVTYYPQGQEFIAHAA